MGYPNSNTKELLNKIDGYQSTEGTSADTKFVLQTLGKLKKTETKKVETSLGLKRIVERLQLREPKHKLPHEGESRFGTRKPNRGTKPKTERTNRTVAIGRNTERPKPPTVTRDQKGKESKPKTTAVMFAEELRLTIVPVNDPSGTLDVHTLEDMEQRVIKTLEAHLEKVGDFQYLSDGVWQLQSHNSFKHKLFANV